MRPGDVVGGRFRLTREAGRGGMGTVFQALDLEQGGTPVAVKVLRRDEDAFDAVSSGRFAREIELLAALDDPRIVRYIAHGELDGLPWLAEEWVDGDSLSEQLDGDGLTIASAIAVVAEVAGGLAAAHRAGIVHRDVKPENILFVGGDPARVKVIDFGIARRTAESTQLTRTGTFVGTPGYISPEQARGAHQIDARCDVFALGCILYECLTGRPPFSGRSLTAIRTKVLLYEPPPLVRTYPELAVLSDAVTAMMAKDPQVRPADGAAVAAILRGMSGLSGEVRTSSPAPAPPTHVTPPPDDAAGERRSGPSTLDTATSGGLACVVIAAGESDGTDHLSDVVRALGARLESLPGNVLLVTPPPALTMVDQVVRAARCALALRPLIAGPIVVTGWTQAPDPDEALAGAIDRGAATLTTMAVSDSQVGITGGGMVRIDRALVAVLEPEFELVREPDGAARLRGLRSR